jgi:NAD(P)H-dependent FMN reductase
VTKIGIILGSTRPGRTGESVARWVYKLASYSRPHTLE